MLEAVQLKKKYGKLEVLKGVDLSIQKGEVVSITGASGAGKSTVLHMLGTLDKPDSGTIRLNDQYVEQLKGKSLARFRNQSIGFIFQFHHLLPEFSALENVCIPGWISGQPTSKLQERAIMLLDRLGLSDRKDHRPGQLSGGEQQRVAVARALINEPAIVLADEPTGNLDSKHAHQLHALFLELSRETQQTFLIVTHNETLAEMSDRVLVMKDGRILS
jgi:lipoprotein-releasing system ATP-binding protein